MLASATEMEARLCSNDMPKSILFNLELTKGSTEHMLGMILYSAHGPFGTGEYGYGVPSFLPISIPKIEKNSSLSSRLCGHVLAQDFWKGYKSV